jgi:DNA-binding transcriptional LysR family regulator
MKDLLTVTSMIGLAPKRTYAAELELGELVTLDSELDPLSADGVIVRRKNAGRSPQLDQFIDEFQAGYLSIVAADGTRT